MITLDPVGHVRSDRKELRDDDWGNVTARIELADTFGPEALDGLARISHHADRSTQNNG